MVVRPFPPSFRMRSLKDPRSGDGPPPGALALLHDLMVCGTGESVSLGLHGNAAVAVRNRRSACSGGNMCQYHPRRSEWPAPDHLAERIAADQPGKAGAWCATVPACSATRDWPPDRAAASEMSRVKAQRVRENSACARKLQFWPVSGRVRQLALTHGLEDIVARERRAPRLLQHGGAVELF